MKVTEQGIDRAGQNEVNVQVGAGVNGKAD